MKTDYETPVRTSRSFGINNIKLEDVEIPKEILQDAGTISHEKALKKAHEEYDKYMQTHLTTAEQDYLNILNKEKRFFPDKGQFKEIFIKEKRFAEVFLRGLKPMK